MRECTKAKCSTDDSCSYYNLFLFLSNGKIRSVCKDLCSNNTLVMSSLTCVMTYAFDGILDLILTPCLCLAVSYKTANPFDIRGDLMNNGEQLSHIERMRTQG